MSESEREKAIMLINEMDEDKNETPNSETLQAFNEGDEMLANGTGQRFEGSTEDFFKSLSEG